jgi:hypothetical protein
MAHWRSVVEQKAIPSGGSRLFGPAPRKVRMDTVQPINKWALTAAGLMIAVAAATLLAGAKAYSTRLAEVCGPVCLWWVSTGLAVALNAALSPPGPWPRGRRARFIAAASGVAVGGWMGGSGAPWITLIILPLYCLIEWLLVNRFFPEDESAVCVPLRVWLGYVIAGQMLGYLVGYCVADCIHVLALHS